MLDNAYIKVVILLRSFMVGRFYVPISHNMSRFEKIHKFQLIFT